MGFLSSKAPSSNSNLTYIEEVENGKIYKPTEFNELLEKIKLLNEFVTYRKYYQDINLRPGLYDKIARKYLRLNGLKRFCIPIIGVISSGKSTFMNYLLHLNNILEIGERVTTQFISIIRHDKNAKIPEIYEVSIERRDDDSIKCHFRQ